MLTETIVTTARRGELVQFVRSIPARLAGTVNDPQGVGHGLRMRIACAFFAMVLLDFDKKSKGETGSDGITWPPNSKAYLAYQKGRAEGHSTVRGRYSVSKRGAVSPLHRKMRVEHLTADQQKTWKKDYTKALAVFATRHPIEQARTLAVNSAWAATRADGAQSLLSKYGQQEDTILVDEGTLRRSLQPGQLAAGIDVDASYSPSSDEQLLEESPGQLVVGSNLNTARWHHYGKGHNPARRFWPVDGLPDVWLRHILSACYKIGRAHV